MAWEEGRRKNWGGRRAGEGEGFGLKKKTRTKTKKMMKEGCGAGKAKLRVCVLHDGRDDDETIAYVMTIGDGSCASIGLCFLDEALMKNCEYDEHEAPTMKMMMHCSMRCEVVV